MPGLELAYLLVGILRIILSDVSLQPGHIEDDHGSLIGSYFSQGLLNQINEGIEEQLQVIGEFLPQLGDL